MQTGSVEAIHIAPAAEAPAVAVDAARAIAGKGIEGDRYFDDGGTFSDDPRSGGRDITLVEAEAVEGLRADTGIELAPGETRRNVVTRGVALNDLVGRRFMVGEVECVGRRLCDPCSHLEKLTQPGVLKGLVNRGGLRADVARDGVIRPGDAVTESAALSPATAAPVLCLVRGSRGGGTRLDQAPALPSRRAELGAAPWLTRARERRGVPDTSSAPACHSSQIRCYR